MSTVTIPVLIHNLSVGGCFVEALHDQLPGRRLTLQIEVPFAGRLQLEAETIYSKPDFGYGAQFVDVSSETHERLSLALQSLVAGATPG